MYFKWWTTIKLITKSGKKHQNFQFPFFIDLQSKVSFIGKSAVYYLANEWNINKTKQNNQTKTIHSIANMKNRKSFLTVHQFILSSVTAVGTIYIMRRCIVWIHVSMWICYLKQKYHNSSLLFQLNGNFVCVVLVQKQNELDRKEDKRTIFICSENYI